MDQIINNIDLPDSLYFKFAKLVYDSAGIALGDAKRELVRSRLMKRLRALHLSTYEQYYNVLANHDQDGAELVMMLDAISTNKTDFFRENQHFDFLEQTIIPSFMSRAENKRRIRVWSAGCSSGEEPYTLAMVMKETLDHSIQWDAKILATDISTKVLQFAHEGVYDEEKIRPVPLALRNAYFTREKNTRALPVYRVKPLLREMITFRRLNLMNSTFPFSGTFDVIFCRNVMIYFDKTTQEALVNKFYRYLSKGGYLFIGHSESLNSLNTPFQFVKPTIYVRGS